MFGKVDTGAQPEVAATFNITSIPTLMIIRDNIVLFAQPGALPEKALEELITKAEALDMNKVRASMAQSAAETPPDSGSGLKARWAENRDIAKTSETLPGDSAASCGTSVTETPAPRG